MQSPSGPPIYHKSVRILVSSYIAVRPLDPSGTGARESLPPLNPLKEPTFGHHCQLSWSFWESAGHWLAKGTQPCLKVGVWGGGAFLGSSGAFLGGRFIVFQIRALGGQLCSWCWFVLAQNWSCTPTLWSEAPVLCGGFMAPT